MPKAASADMFRPRRLMIGEVQAIEPGGLKGIIPVAGLMPALVPGMVEAALVALREYGTMSFAEVIAPAIEIGGRIPLDESRANSIDFSRRFFELWPTSKAHFLPEGRLPMPGEIFRQADLARTLRVHGGGGEGKGAERSGKDRGNRCGSRSFLSRRYCPAHRCFRSAARRVAPVRRHGGVSHHARRAGVHGLRGLPGMQAGLLEPGTGDAGAAEYSGEVSICGRSVITPPTICIILTETMKLAYADRDTWYGDPRMVNVPAASCCRRNTRGDAR